MIFSLPCLLQEMKNFSRIRVEGMTLVLVFMLWVKLSASEQ